MYRNIVMNKLCKLLPCILMVFFISLLSSCGESSKEQELNLINDPIFESMLNGETQDIVQELINVSVNLDIEAKRQAAEKAADHIDSHQTRLQNEEYRGCLLSYLEDYAKSLEAIIETCDSLENVSVFLNNPALISDLEIRLEKEIEHSNEKVDILNTYFESNSFDTNCIAKLYLPQKETTPEQIDLQTLIAADSKGTNQLRSAPIISRPNSKGEGTFFLLEIQQLLNSKNVLAWLVIDNCVFKLNMDSGVGMITFWPDSKEYQNVWSKSGLPSTFRITTHNIYDALLEIDKL